MIILGISGGLGNQLFQYAVALALQDVQQDDIVLDVSDCNIRPFSLHHFALMQDHPTTVNIRKQTLLPVRTLIRRCVTRLNYIVLGLFGRKVESDVISLLLPILHKLGFYICPMRYWKLGKAWSRNKIVYGYFQSHRYFDHIRGTILDKFQTITPPSHTNETILQTITSHNTVCVHIRRGDYVRDASTFLICNEKYYLEGMRVICERVEQPVFYIFSDDIEWCKTNIAFEHEVTFVEGDNPDYEELRLMSACKHFVISNSSFSWWAQYLSTATDKVVVAPSKWLNDDVPMDIWMPNWHIIKINETRT